MRFEVQMGAGDQEGRVFHDLILSRSQTTRHPVRMTRAVESLGDHVIIKHVQVCAARCGGITLDVKYRNMSNTTKAVLSSLPFLVIGLIALLFPKYQEWQAAKFLEKLEVLPLKSSISVSGKRTTSSRHTFSVGRYGVTDVGNLRLVFAELPFSGSSSSSSITLATDSTKDGRGGRSGAGNRRFETKQIPHGSECTFGGVTFKFVDGKLTFGEETIDATGPPTLVLIGANRKILETKMLGFDRKGR